MRKILATAATLGLAGLGVIVPTTAAQASTACDNAWNNAVSGHFYAYDYANCSGYIGSDADSDANWGDSSGSFQGGADNSATSVLHRGPSGLAVKVYQGSGYGGGHICLQTSEAYVDDLAGTTFSNGAPANNNISSHTWLWSSACGKFLE